MINLGVEIKPSALERFVCSLYRHKKFNKIKDLRWFLYSNRQAQAENLPPTNGSLDLHILRAHYVTILLRASNQNIISLPPIEDFGWKTEESGHRTPLLCSLPPAPKGVTSLVKFGCKKGCTKSCACYKNKLSCTELCHCMKTSCLNLYNKIDEEAFEGEEANYDEEEGKSNDEDELLITF